MQLLLLLTFLIILFSFLKDKNKTLTGTRQGIKMFFDILPQVLNVLILVSILLYLVPDSTILRWFGKNSGFSGMVISAVAGSISLIPGFIAYPLSALLLKKGVSYNIVAIFITTLMMVGILTLPVESKYFGIKVAIFRNFLSFIGALIIGILIGIFM